MKQITVSLLFSLSILFSFAQTQLEMNNEAAAKFKKTEKILNSTFQKIIKEYHSDTLFIKNLRKAQKIWLQLRDAELKAKFPDPDGSNYGTIFPVCWSMYADELTTERIKRLKVWLTGTEEGDVCSGSVKVIPHSP